MTLLRPSTGACPREQLPDYVAGRLDAASTRWWDRHLVTCVGCSRAVDQERMLRSALTGGVPRPRGDLRSALVAMGRLEGELPCSGGERAGPSAPEPRRSPALAPLAPLPVLRPGAPPCHRSALRSAVVAAAAAGATAATAWSLSIAGAGAAAAPAARVSQPGPPAPVSAVPGASTGAGSAVLTVRWPGPGAAPAGRGGPDGR
jgi:hypothetical protein